MPDARCFCENGSFCSLGSFICLTLVGLYSIKCIRVIMRGGSQGNSCHHRVSHWKSPHFHALALLALFKSIPREFPQGKGHLSVIKKKSIILDDGYSWLFQQSWSFSFFFFFFPFTFTLLQNYFCLLKWISVLPFLLSFQYLPKCSIHAPTHVHNHRNLFLGELQSPRKVTTPVYIQPVQRGGLLIFLTFTQCK